MTRRTITKTCFNCKVQFDTQWSYDVCYGCRYQLTKSNDDKHCPDCGKSIKPTSRRCQPCAMKARRGPNNPNWKGKKYTSKGYVLLSGHYDHPNANGRGEIREHVFTMSSHLGRPLMSNEEVHHKNGIKDDNRLENLELWSVGHQPKGQRVEDLVAWAKQILDLYGDFENT